MSEKAKKKLCIDLCCGLKGFSGAFSESPDWDIVTVDIDKKFEPTICADVRELSFLDIMPNSGRYDNPDYEPRYEAVVILASPPCERYSLACRQFPRHGIRKAFEIVGQCCEIIASARDYFIEQKLDYKNNLRYAIENPKGRLRWFLGTPDFTFKQCDYGAPWKKLTDIWTNIDMPMVRADREAKFYVFREGTMNAKHPKRVPDSPAFLSGKDKAERAKLPYEFSKAILEAV